MIGIQVIIVGESYPCFVSGAACSLDDFNSTVQKAFYEAETRLIYGLNNPEITMIRPESVSSVTDHELLFAQNRDFHRYIEYLFSSEEVWQTPTATAMIEELLHKLDVAVVDVSEPGSPIFVIKAISPKLIPINFGYGTEHYTHSTLDGVAKVCHEIPHYFA